MAAPMAIMGLGAAAGGAVLSAYGNMQKGSADAAMYNYQAGVATQNAAIAKQNADYAIYAGEVEAQTQGLKTRAQIGTAKAMQGAGGLDVSSGSNVDVRTSMLEVGQQDAAIIRSNAAKKAFGYEIEASQDTAQAGAFRASAKQSKTAGTIAAIGSLLGGASSVSSKWTAGSQAGVFS